MITPVIMAGGSGTRLWPISRSSHPKQFISLQGKSTMLQDTLNRIRNLTKSDPIIICNEKHRFFVAEQLRQIDRPGTILLEPFARNTAPAIALAALYEKKQDTVLLVLPADHVIQDESGFRKAIQKALPLAEDGKLVTFGIAPTEPHTGYGYIEAGEEMIDGFKVNSFREKPNIKEAEDFIRDGNYFWNSGMFLFKANQYLKELKNFRPKIYQICQESTENFQTDLDFTRINKTVFEKCPNESIDYAVMEETENAVVFPLNAGWSDIGSWSSLWEISKKDERANAIYGDVLTHKTSNSYIKSEEKLVAVVGVDNLVIVSNKDSVLIANKDNDQDIKEIVKNLESNSRTEFDLHREVHRPWGKFDSVDSGDGYQVKRITVNPGAKLSVQMHHKRSEHWVVVKGIAHVGLDKSEYILNENQSIYIPLGSIHWLENREKTPLEVIEVQTGTYLGEDDIVRFEDTYGRIDNE